jgi:hypothetical protein
MVLLVSSMLVGADEADSSQKRILPRGPSSNLIVSALGAPTPSSLH